MLKFLGMLLLTGCCLRLGLEKARSLVRRAETLETWQAALGLLTGEMAFRMPDMPALLEGLSQRAGSPAAETFAAAAKGMKRLGEHSFAEIWCNALEVNCGALDGEDRATLARLGNVLGRYGWEDQCQAVETVARDLGERARQARTQLGREGKAYGTLGLALGAFLSILLL